MRATNGFLKAAWTILYTPQEALEKLFVEELILAAVQL
jgi:hypothetical protein